jgi:hypothetical protein
MRDALRGVGRRRWREAEWIDTTAAPANCPGGARVLTTTKVGCPRERTADTSSAGQVVDDGDLCCTGRS